MRTFVIGGILSPTGSTTKFGVSPGEQVPIATTLNGRRSLGTRWIMRRNRCMSHVLSLCSTELTPSMYIQTRKLPCHSPTQRTTRLLSHDDVRTYLYLF